MVWYSYCGKVWPACVAACMKPFVHKKILQNQIEDLENSKAVFKIKESAKVKNRIDKL